MSVALPAYALEGDTFRPFVSFSRYYDDNLFRQAENEAIFIDGSVKRGPQADSYNVLAFGANVDWRVSRQQILARATKSLCVTPTSIHWIMLGQIISPNGIGNWEITGTGRSERPKPCPKAALQI